MAKQGALATAQLLVAGAFLLHAPTAVFATFGREREARKAEEYSEMARSRMAAVFDMASLDEFFRHSSEAKKRKTL